MLLCLCTSASLPCFYFGLGLHRCIRRPTFDLLSTTPHGRSVTISTYPLSFCYYCDPSLCNPLTSPSIQSECHYRFNPLFFLIHSSLYVLIVEPTETYFQHSHTNSGRSADILEIRKSGALTRPFQTLVPNIITSSSLWDFRFHRFLSCT